MYTAHSCPFSPSFTQLGRFFKKLQAPIFQHVQFCCDSRCGGLLWFLWSQWVPRVYLSLVSLSCSVDSKSGLLSTLVFDPATQLPGTSAHLGCSVSICHQTNLFMVNL